MKTPQRKNHKWLSLEELENKIITKYTKQNPEPRTLEDRVQKELKKLA